MPLAQNEIETALGPRPDPKQSIEDQLGPRPIAGPLHGEAWDQYFATGLGGDVTNAFGPFQIGPEDEKTLKRVADPDYIKGRNQFFEDYQNGVFRPQAYRWLGNLGLGLSAGFTGTPLTDEDKNVGLGGAAGLAAGAVLGSALSPAYSAYSATQKMLSGELITPEEGAAAATAIALGQRAIAPYRTIMDAARAGITKGDIPHEQVLKSLTPTGEPTETERVIIPPTSEVERPPLTEPPPAPTDIHGMARQMEPELFDTWDALVEQKEAQRQQIEAIRSSEAQPFQDQIDTILGKVGGVEDRLTKSAAERLEAARHNLEYTMGHDSPERAAARRQMMAADERMRDMAPDVSAAYRAARDRMPDAEPPIPARVPDAVMETDRVAAASERGGEPVNLPSEAPAIQNEAQAADSAGPVRFTTAKGSVYTVHEDGTTTRNKSFHPEHGEADQGLQPRSEATFYVSAEDAQKLGEIQSIGGSSRIVAPLGDGRWGVKYLDGKDAGKFERRTVVSPVSDRPAAGLTPVEIFNGGKRVHFGNEITGLEGKPAAAPTTLKTLAQRRVPIAQQVAADLREAGRPAEEARESGALVQAYYEARAQRFGGRQGTAQELYDQDAPSIVGATGAARGRFDLAQNTIRLFDRADASTFVHESAHAWFEDMIRDAARDDAPDDLKEDMNAVRAWLQMESDRPTRAQHERFARTFERYLMEGHAPSTRLAGVFEKFKQWLTTIYQTVARLRAPINDEIRGVYDRLLSTNRETVVAPERAPGRNFADLHESDLAAAPAEPEAMVAKADEIRAEREQVAQILRTEINNARQRARQRPVAGETGQPGPTVPSGGGATEAEGGPGGAVVSETTGAGSVVEPDGAPLGSRPVEISPSGNAVKVKGTAPQSPNDSFGPTNSRIRDSEGKPILDNINAPEDIDRAVREGHEAELSDRGPISDTQLLELSDALGMDGGEVASRREDISRAYTAAEITRLKEMLVESATDVRNKMKEAAESGDPYDLAVSMARHRMLQAKAVGIGSEWGYAGRALHDLKVATGARSVEQLDTLLRSTSGMDYDSLMQLARTAQNLPTPRQVSQLVRNTRPQMSPMGRFVAWWVTNSWLSGPFTHMAYVVGNEQRALLWRPLEQGLAGAIGAVRTALGGQQDRAYMSEAGAMLLGVIKGHSDGLRPAWESYQAGKQTPLPGAITTANPFNNYVAPSSTIETVFGQPTKVVAAIHQYGRVQFYTGHLYALATRQGLSEGLWGDALAQRTADLVRNPTEDLMAAARNAADTDMFQRQTPWSDLQSKIANYTDSHLWAKMMFPFVKIGFEYTREQFIKRTPLGVFSSEVRGDLLGRRGGAAADEAWAKMTLGTGLLASGAMYAAQGILEGSGPPYGTKERAEWELTHRGNRINLGPFSVPLQGLGAQTSLMLFGASLWETAQYAKSDELGDLASAYSKATLKAGLTEGAFQDIMNLASVIDDPAKNALPYVANLAMGLVPYSSMQSQLNREWIDPYAKDISPGVQGIFDRIKARMPATSWAVPDRVDMFGNPLPTRGIEVEGASLTNATDRYRNDPTVQWLNRLGIGASRLKHDIEGIPLTHSQYTAYATMSGQILKEQLDMAVQGGIENWPRPLQVQELGKLITKSRHMARMQVQMNALGSDNDILQKAYEKKMAPLTQ